MFPQLEMAFIDGTGEVLPTVDFETGEVLPTIDFDRKKYSPAQIRAIQNQFTSQKHNHDQATEGTLGQPLSAMRVKR